MGSIPVCMGLYAISRPGENGEETRLEKWLAKVSDKSEEWHAKNQRNTALIEQACHDRHLLTYAPSTNGHHEIVYPE